MGRLLRSAGLLILAGAAWLLLAESAGWVSSEVSSAWVVPAIWGGAGALALGVVLGMLRPVGRRMRAVRCVRCGATIERGQTYCADHLRQTLDEYRDRQRETMTGRSAGPS